MKKLKMLLAMYFKNYEYMAVATGPGKPEISTDALAEALVEAVVEQLRGSATAQAQAPPTAKTAGLAGASPLAVAKTAPPAAPAK